MITTYLCLRNYYRIFNKEYIYWIYKVTKLNQYDIKVQGLACNQIFKEMTITSFTEESYRKRLTHLISMNYKVFENPDLDIILTKYFDKFL